MTAAMTAAMLFGGSAVVGTTGVIPAPGPAPAPIPGPIDPTPTPNPTPLPATPFAQALAEAFAADGGTPQQAAERGAMLASMAQAIRLAPQHPQIKLASVADVASSYKLAMQVRGFTQSESPQASAVLHAELSKIPQGPLDETRRQALIQVFGQAGDALLAQGGG